MRTLTFLIVTLSAVLDSSAADLRAQARSALERATAYMRSIATEGGYLWQYSLDLKERAGEVQATATQIWVQPPGTPSMGLAFLRAYEATSDPRYLDAAQAAAEALARGQVESGGWDYLVDFDPEKMRRSYFRTDRGQLSPAEVAQRKNLTNFDDDNTQSAIRLLLAVVAASEGSRDARVVRLREALDYGLTKMLEAQYPNGAWPQRWLGEPHPAEDFPVLKARYPEAYPREFPKTKYYTYYTLNDNSLRDCILTLLDAHRRTGKAEYLAAAKRGGEFLILAQLPEPQPAWAQQYNARMEPAWARAFEPPAVTGNESVGALRTLLDLYVQTGDERFLQPLPAAAAWFQRSAIAPDRWARYYELQTNRQIFGDRDGKIYYRLEDISEERQHGYSWSGSYGVSSLLAYYDKVKDRSPANVRKMTEKKAASRKSKAAEAATLEPRVREIIAALDEQGRWVSRGHVEKRNWKFDDRVETQVFIKNATTLAAYLEALK